MDARRPRMLTRRELVALLVAGMVVSPSHAQERLRRVGLLSSGPVVTPGLRTSWRGELVRVLSQHGFSLGRNLELVDRYAEGNLDRLPVLAHEIHTSGVDVVLAITGAAVRAMMAASRTTPIVMVVGDDPVELGFVSSLARPGGQVTGLNFQTIEGDAKRLQLLREAIPGARRLGFLVFRGSGKRPIAVMTRAAESLSIELVIHVVGDAGDYATAFAAMKKDNVAGVLIESTQILSADAFRLSALAEAMRLPTICEWDYMARVGCMLGYGHDLAYAHRRAGEYVVRILKGTSPADLPVEQSDAWRLVINLGVAGRIGHQVPSAVLARADEVIE